MSAIAITIIALGVTFVPLTANTTGGAPEGIAGSCNYELNTRERLKVRI